MHVVPKIEFPISYSNNLDACVAQWAGLQRRTSQEEARIFFEKVVIPCGLPGEIFQESRKSGQIHQTDSVDGFEQRLVARECPPANDDRNTCGEMLP